MDIKHYYENTELTLEEIAKKTNHGYRTVWNYIKANSSVEYRNARKRISYKNSKLGNKNPRFGQPALHAKEIVSDNKGYWMTLKPDWYTGRKNSKHIFYHHFIVCKNLDITQIPKGWCVHHCDLNPSNNVFDNLVLMTQSDHQKFHGRVIKGATTISKESTLKWVEAHGTPFRRDDIVSSIQECIAATSGQELTTLVEDK